MARHPDDFVVTPELLAEYLAGFQAPGPDETDVRVVRTAEDPPAPEE